MLCVCERRGLVAMSESFDCSPIGVGDYIHHYQVPPGEMDVQVLEVAPCEIDPLSIDVSPCSSSRHNCYRIIDPWTRLEDWVCGLEFVRCFRDK